MSLRAQVAVLPKGSGPLQIQEVPFPDPGPHQVVVRLRSSGVCGTQIHQIRGERPTDRLLGHEACGEVIAAGPEVTAAGVGQDVIVTWIPCRDIGGRAIEHAQLTLGDGSVPAVSGAFTWADHTLVDEALVSPVQAGLPTAAAIIGCAVMTGAGAVLRAAQVTAGNSVAVFGAGGVGLSAIAAAAHVGADPIFAVDLDTAKLGLAKSLGATRLIDASSVDPVREILDLTRGQVRSTAGQVVEGVDFAFDCVGSNVTTAQALGAVHAAIPPWEPNGTTVLVGIPSANYELVTREIFRGKTFRGALAGGCMPDRDFPVFIEWSQTGQLDLDQLVTDRYPFEDINAATDALQEGRVRGRAIVEFHH